jgi:DUF2892 family protein
MTKNMGNADRIIRTVLAVVIGGLYFTGRISGTVAIVLLALAVMFLVTSAVGSCPGYLPFGFSSRGKQAGSSS